MDSQNALLAAGFPEPTLEDFTTYVILCDAFENNDVDIINEVAAADQATDQAISEELTVVFGVLCPTQAARAGVAVMPNGDSVFPGYPLIVDVGTIDSRVASSFGNLVDGQVVALAPGVYTPYNPIVPDLVAYLGGPNDGDCIMRDQYFPNSGGTCWDGVQPGSAEPEVAPPG